MSRIVFLLAVSGLLMILFTGIGAVWVTHSDIAKTRQTAAEVLTNGTGLSIWTRIDVINQTLERMSQDSEVRQAVIDNNPETIKTVTDKLERNFPGALKIRLMLPGATELDTTGNPKMTLADLDMVREALSAPPEAAIHGDSKADRHLAIARKISNGQETVGVILASLRYDFIGEALKAGRNNGNGYFQLNQDKLVLASAGTKNNSGQQAVSSSFSVPGTLWELEYAAPYSDALDYTTLSGIIGIPAVLYLIVYLVAQRKLSKMLMNDLSSVMTAFKDMKKNKFRGHYPIGLKEFNVVISALGQFKRLGDQEEDEEIEISQQIRTTVADSDLLTETGLWQESEIKTQPKTKKASEKALSHGNDASTFDMLRLFQNYDIRGQFGADLSREDAYNIGRALGTEAIAQDCQTLVIARDSAKSSQELAEILMQGIAATGCNVLDIGMAPTPLLYFVAHHTESRSGLMVTSKAEPTPQNCLMMTIKGETLVGERIQQLRQCIENQAFASSASGGKRERNDRYGNEYIGVLSEDIHIARPMKVVLDCGNGIAGKIGPLLLRTIGCEVIELFCEVDPSCPNHQPNPKIPENLADLIKSVGMSQADVGIAMDGDGNCLAVVDSKGNIIAPDRLMMLFAKDVLAGKPGAEILYDVKCSRLLADQITKYGGRPAMCKTGHGSIKTKLRETGAKLAGEFSGHIYFNDRWFGFDDAFYAACRLIEILSADNHKSAEVFAQLPDSINTPEILVSMADGEHRTLMTKLTSDAKFSGGKITAIDGLRVEFPDGWGLVRAANTSIALMLRFEADNAEALKSIQNQFRERLVALKPDIILPF